MFLSIYDPNIPVTWKTFSCFFADIARFSNESIWWKNNHWIFQSLPYLSISYLKDTWYLYDKQTTLYMEASFIQLHLNKLECRGIISVIQLKLWNSCIK